MSKERIVIVEDDELMLDSMSITLKKGGYDTIGFSQPPEALKFIEENGADVVITDLKMPQMDGIEVLKRTKKINSQIPVIIITAYGTVEKAVEAMKEGAFNFITKPLKSPDELEVIVDKAIEHSRLLSENEYLKEEIAAQFSDMVGETEKMKHIYQLIQKVAPTDATVLIRGKSGTGKELVARALHTLSPRRNRPFIKVNCAALSAGLLESELFGHEKGAFTGADRRRKGRFEIAEGGTILLDEISELDINLQAKLLRVLQEKEFEPVGSNITKKVDVRILATTNRDLEKSVEEGKFREDLFYRLNVVSIHLPPLNERKEDIPLLINYFLEKKCKKLGIPVKKISPEALQKALAYDWPGNVRELENTIERAIILSEGEFISEKVLSLDGIITSSGKDGIEELAGKISLAEMEKKFIIATYHKCDKNIKKSCSILGITSKTLREKLSRWGEI